MYTEKQIERMLGKLKRLEDTLEPLLFKKVDEISMKICQTDGDYTKKPDDSLFEEVPDGTTFMGEGIYCWTKGEYTVPAKLEGKRLFFYSRTEAYEGLMFVDDMPYGNFASKKLVNSHGNHYCNMFSKAAEAGRTYRFAVEYYANHYIKGTQPLTPDPEMEYKIVYHPADVCVANEAIGSFYYNLKIANQMAGFLDKDSYRRAAVIRGLKKVHEIIYYDYENVERELFEQAAIKADSLLKEVLDHKNSDSAPYVGMVGHSHMDTAWLWHRGETEKKCARTYANQMSLMDQYPEYTFIQSSAYHGDIIRRMYPILFEEMKKKIAEGRYEPNGGVWIECDCNIPSGEYMVRQFLLGQRFTRKYFNYTSDTFWLPDTFGYSAAFPQIMKGCGVKYFLTTKISWNDTNVFPYDTFIWKGIDGTGVLTHFNRSHLWPSPEMMISGCMKGGDDSVKERVVSDMRLFSYGYGDGGGGPEFEMVELADRLKDVEGLPKSSHTTVSAFMKRLEERITEPSTYSGELYLELHRGTLTNQHTIKRNNRKAEIALRNLEYFTVRHAIGQGIAASEEKITPLMEELLINQFHDILPGTGIPRVHQESIEAVNGILQEARKQQKELLEQSVEDTMTLYNTLSFSRRDVTYLPYEGRMIKGEVAQQITEDVNGVKKLAVAGMELPAFSGRAIKMEERRRAEINNDTPFDWQDDLSYLETPFYIVAFNEKGYLEALTDKRCGRQLRGEGYAFNTLLIGEDVPLGWDNWDIDVDCECKLRDEAIIVKRELVSAGAVEFRIRNHYQLTPKSMLVQDVVFYKESPMITFETKVDWQDDHRLLKAAFDTNIHTDGANQEIQFGYLRRPTNRNTSIEKAKFEVSNHKYTDMSETRYGISLFNDCKYGISVQDSSMHLSLHKGGCMPDYLGDKGVHEFSYAIYPHQGGFTAANVIQPAYAFNIPAVGEQGANPMESLVRISEDNVIVEAVKPLEDSERAYLLRIYEAEGTRTAVTLEFSTAVRAVSITNMLEEEQESLGGGVEIPIVFEAFEIKSIKISY